ncbi:hypothetical protein Csa_015533 [Cucumis sativus]|uniref:Uncharacterized protein n=1 Tax=Cucumis sativus TaxID=3659 RepID=A0A0A0K733_CUCSA|nr:hypothetical protein Csa_015533 [Cucumis sativus]
MLSFSLLPESFMLESAAGAGKERILPSCFYTGNVLPSPPLLIINFLVIEISRLHSIYKLSCILFTLYKYSRDGRWKFEPQNHEVINTYFMASRFMLVLASSLFTITIGL